MRQNVTVHNHEVLISLALRLFERPNGFLKDLTLPAFFI
jgi:hypothetical protein